MLLCWNKEFKMLNTVEIRREILKAMRRKCYNINGVAKNSGVHVHTIMRMLSKQACNPRLETLNLVLDSLNLELIIRKKT